MSGAQSSVEIAGEDSRHTINRSRWRATTTAPPAAIGKGGGLRVEVEKTKLAGRARLGGSACAVQQQRYLPRSQYGRRRPEPAAAPKPRARQHIDGEDTGQQLSPCNFRRRRRTRLSCINRTPGERQQSRLRRLGLLRAPSRRRSNRGTQNGERSRTRPHTAPSERPAEAPGRQAEWEQGAHPAETSRARLT